MQALCIRLTVAVGTKLRLTETLIIPSTEKSVDWELIKIWIEGIVLDNVNFKAVMIMLSLLLQKPSKNSKARDYLVALERRMKLSKDEEKKDENKGKTKR